MMLQRFDMGADGGLSVSEFIGSTGEVQVPRRALKRANVSERWMSPLDRGSLPS